MSALLISVKIEIAKMTFGIEEEQGDNCMCLGDVSSIWRSYLLAFIFMVTFCVLTQSRVARAEDTVSKLQPTPIKGRYLVGSAIDLTREELLNVLKPFG